MKAVHLISLLYGTNVLLVNQKPYKGSKNNKNVNEENIPLEEKENKCSI
jgi:hypothetical protein